MSCRSIAGNPGYPWTRIAPTCLAVCWLLAGCGGSDLVLPSSVDAGSIRVVSGDGQQAPVGAPLAAPVVVEVTDGQDAPVGGVTVQFALTSAGEGAEVTPDTVRTNAAGRAQAHVLLGDKVGLQTGEVRVMGSAGDLPSTTFVALAVPDTGARGSPPSANFTWHCNALTCRFSDASTDADGRVTGWLWRFGDGTTSAEPSPSHQYGEAGTYGVTLTVTDDAGGSDIATNQVTVNAAPAANDPPEADFSVSCRERTCSFTDRSTDPDGSVTGWAWEFGDGATSTARNPSRTYAAPGQYTVTLRVTDDGGAHAARTRTVTATAPTPEPNEPPRAGFSVTCQELTCSFTDRSNDPDGTIASRQWDFGDGGTSTDRNPSHHYDEAGSYNVRLTVADNDGASDAASNQVTATAPPANVSPHAEFAVSCDHLTCRFTDQSTDSDGTIASRAWDFGDGATSTERNPSHTYAAGGQYSVTLRITDDDGAGDTRTHPASPTEPPPEPNDPPHADFKVRCHKLACAFDDTSTDADGTVVRWQWSFGDGATSSEPDPSHDYADRGHYEVQLTVTDDDGATASVTHRVDIKR